MPGLVPEPDAEADEDLLDLRRPDRLYDDVDRAGLPQISDSRVLRVKGRHHDDR
jgi:hypothetical protein